MILYQLTNLILSYAYVPHQMLHVTLCWLEHEIAGEKKSIWEEW